MSAPDDPRPRSESPEPEPRAKTDVSSLVGWGLFVLLAAGLLLYRIFSGGGC